MKLLVCTQIVDSRDHTLGFFHRWIEEFAKHCETVSVICLKEGTHAFPQNVKVYSLGKEQGSVSRAVYAWRFLKLIWRLRKEYTEVFVHMNPEYVVLGYVFWRVWGKKIGLWYTHKSVTPVLRIATVFSQHLFTASRASFRLESAKLVIIGHGIDTTFFSTAERVPGTHGEIRVLSAGRLSRTKRHDLIMRACSRIPHARLRIAGAPATAEDEVYAESLRSLASELHMESRVEFTGAVTQEELRVLYRNTDVFAHASETGSYDKVVLEALASGIPVVTTSEAFADRALPVLLADATPEALAESITYAMQNPQNPAVLAESIKQFHSITHCIRTILSLYS